jgi:hypothetical protein
MLPDYIDLLVYPSQPNGAGGYEAAENPTKLNRYPINCRITTMFGEKNKERWGFSGPEFRHVYIEPNIAEFENSGVQAIALSTNSNTSVIKKTDVFRIKHMTQQRDEAGILHHTTVIAEFADDLSS